MKFYAVRKGRTTGLFTSWELCKASIDKFSGSEFKSFKNEEEAKAYLDGVNTAPESISVENVETIKEATSQILEPVNDDLDYSEPPW